MLDSRVVLDLVQDKFCACFRQVSWLGKFVWYMALTRLFVFWDRYRLLLVYELNRLASVCGIFAYAGCVWTWAGFSMLQVLGWMLTVCIFCDIGILAQSGFLELSISSFLLLLQFYICFFLSFSLLVFWRLRLVQTLASLLEPSYWADLQSFLALFCFSDWLCCVLLPNLSNTELMLLLAFALLSYCSCIFHVLLCLKPKPVSLNTFLSLFLSLVQYLAYYIAWHVLLLKK